MVRKTRKNRTKIKRVTLSNRGGRVVGEGGYGCVYRPPLPCEGSTTRPKNTVSKLMNENDAMKEIMEINHIKRLTNKIPFNHLYFSISNDIKMCKPNWSSFTKDDNSGECNILSSTSDIRNLNILQIPDAGNDSVDDYLLNQNFNNAVGFAKFTKNMLGLLINGIIPLNELGGYHHDIKGDNIMVKDNMPILIDWGLSYVSNTGKVIDASRKGKPMGLSNEVQKEPMRAIIMFNSPFSAPFFFNTAWDIEPTDLKISSSRTGNLQESLSYYNSNIKSLPLEIQKSAHYMYFSRIIKLAEQKSGLSYNKSSSKNSLFLSYINRIRDAYVNNFVIDFDSFYADWHHNADIWGWIMSFKNILDNSKPENIKMKEWNTIQKVIGELIIYTITGGAIRLEVDKIINILKPILNMDDEDLYSPSTSFLEREINRSPSSSFVMINSVSPIKSGMMFKDNKSTSEKKSKNKLYNTLKKFRMQWKRKNKTNKKLRIVSNFKKNT